MELLVTNINEQSMQGLLDALYDLPNGRDSDFTDENYFEYIPDAIDNFFDSLGIYEDECLEISKQYESEEN